MQQQDPFAAAGFIPVGQAPQAGGLTAVPLPDKPNLPAGYSMGPDGTAHPIPGLPPEKGAGNYRTLTADEVKAQGLPAGVYQLGPNGKLDKVTDAPVDANAGLQTTLDQLANVVKAAKRAKARSNGWFMTGFGSNMIGSHTAEGKSLQGDLSIIGSNTAFDRLQQMRDSSKTGGALGSVSEQELNLLRSSIASLDPSQTDKDFQRNMDTVIEHYGKLYQSLGGKPDALLEPMVDGQKIDAPAPDAVDIPMPNLEASTDGTRSVIDEKKRVLGGKIVALAQKGADRNTIMGFAVRNDPTLRNDPKFRAWVDQAIAYRKANPGRSFPVDPSFYTSQVPMTADEQKANAKGQTDAGAALIGAADAVTAGNLGRLGGLVGGDKARIDQSVQLSARDNPTASTIGQIGGGTLAALGGEAALAKFGLNPGITRALLSDGGYGAVAGGTNAPDGEGLMGAAKGAAIGSLGSLVGMGGTNVLGKMAKGVSDPTVSYVARELPGRLTVGQMVGQSGRLGGIVKRAEDTIAGLPVVGDMVNARRLEGIQGMNAKTFDRALEPIKENVAGKFGEEAVADAQQKVSGAFQKALSGKIAQIDPPFITSAATAKRSINALPDRVAGEVENSVDEIIKSYVDPNTLSVTGENMQAMLQELDGVKRAYRNDPLGHRIGKAVDQVTTSVEGLFQRQAPEVMPQYKAAKKAFQRLAVVEDAVLRAKNSGGVFTPGQLGMADRAGTVKFGGKHKAAAGGSEFHDFQRAMQDVLPNKVPDSGTAGRLIVPLALTGAGAGVGAAGGDAQAGSQTGLTLGALLSLAYSRHGQGLLRTLVRPSGPAGQAIGRGLQRASRPVGAAVSTQSVLGAR